MASFFVKFYVQCSSRCGHERAALHEVG